MAALARSFKIDAIEEDPSLVEGTTKDCFDCDIDNPKAAAKLLRKLNLAERPANFAAMLRAACETCSGSGQQKIAAAEIAAELKASKTKDVLGIDDHDEVSKRRKKKSKPPSDDDDGDLYLEY